MVNIFTLKNTDSVCSHTVLTAALLQNLHKHTFGQRQFHSTQTNKFKTHTAMVGSLNVVYIQFLAFFICRDGLFERNHDLTDMVEQLNAEVWIYSSGCLDGFINQMAIVQRITVLVYEVPEPSSKSFVRFFRLVPRLRDGNGTLGLFFLSGLT